MTGVLLQNACTVYVDGIEETAYAWRRHSSCIRQFWTTDERPKFECVHTMEVLIYGKFVCLFFHTVWRRPVFQKFSYRIAVYVDTLDFPA